MEKLPLELDLDEFMIARAFSSPDTVVRMLGVQSFIIRTSCYHFRFTLHRPYASSHHLPSPAATKTNRTNLRKTRKPSVKQIA